MFDAGALSPVDKAAAAGLQVGGRCLPGVPRQPQQQGIRASNETLRSVHEVLKSRSFLNIVGTFSMIVRDHVIFGNHCLRLYLQGIPHHGGGFGQHGSRLEN